MACTRILINNLSKQYSKLCIQNSSSCSKNVLRSDSIVQHYSQTAIPSNYSHSFFARSSKNVLSSDCIMQHYSQHLITWRHSHSFFARITADQLWKGCTSVSPAGRRKGRGKKKKMIKDLNRGQVIGCGKKNMLWPGLNAPVIQGREVLHQQELPPDLEREKRLLEIRNKLTGRRRMRIHPLERGWSGTKLPGRSLGAPDPVGDETFEGFDSRVLQFRTVAVMTGQRGRVRRLSAFVVVGNKNGLAGFALAKSVNGAAAAKAAKNRAAKQLRYIKKDNDTVVHDFFTQFGAVSIFVERRPPGHGLVCQRAIRAICQVLGIKDLYAKIEGPSQNTQNLAKAFFIGLMRQKSLEELANEKGLHIVKLQKNRDHFPEVVASPKRCRTEEEIPSTEQLDYTLHLHGGKVVRERKKYQPFYINFPSFIKEMKDREKLRNHRDVRIHLLAKYGELKSFVQIKEEEKAKQELKSAVEQK